MTGAQTPVPEKQSNLQVILSVLSGLIVLKQTHTNHDIENEVLCFGKLKSPGNITSSNIPVQNATKSEADEICMFKKIATLHLFLKKPEK